MKKIFYLFLVLIAAIIAWLLFAHNRSAVKLGQITSTTNTEQSLSPAPQMQQSTAPQNVAKSQTTNTPTVKQPTFDELIQREFSHPFLFYGKVIDQDNAPVQGATASFNWATPEGDEQYASSPSDSEGLFSMEKGKGYKLQITVSKNGYYARHSENLTTIAYGDELGHETYKANPANPVIFHLRKKGVGVALITSQNGVSPDFSIHIPRDGTPIKVDMMQRKVGDTGQMIVTENKPEFKDWKQAIQWSFKVEIPDGGFIGENDDFPFEAPEEGYQPAMEFDFQKSNYDWTTDIKTNFYIKFGTPPVYGRLQIQTGISYGGAILTYAINPSGSRNLEPAQQ